MVNDMEEKEKKQQQPMSSVIPFVSHTVCVNHFTRIPKW